MDLQQTANTQIYEKTRYKLVLHMCFLFLVLISIVSAVNYSNPRYNAIPDFFVVAVCILSLLILKTTQKYKLVGIFASIATFLVIAVTILFVKAIHYTTPVWMVVCILFTFVVLNKIWGLISLIANFSVLFVYLIFVFTKNFNTAEPLKPSDAWVFVMEFAIIGIAVGYVLYLFVYATEKSEKNMSDVNETLNVKNALILKQNEEMEVMLKEIHHRVKNNLQIISSLLRLQADKINADQRDVFYEAVNRVSAMAIIHEKMYQSSSLSNVDLEQYLCDLKDNLLLSYSASLKVEIQMTVSIAYLTPKSMIPFALLFNELFMNSMKHAFVEQQYPKITCKIYPEKEDSFMFEYADNGKWKIQRPNSFGLEIIDAMTEQLEGTKQLDISEKGSFYKFQLVNLTS